MSKDEEKSEMKEEKSEMKEEKSEKVQLIGNSQNGPSSSSSFSRNTGGSTEQLHQRSKMEKRLEKLQQENGGFGSGFTGELEKTIEDLSNKETENLVKAFQDQFNKCTNACRRPNILVAGITGAGKSSLINAIFGEEVAKSGAGMPVTQHFQKFEPKDKPVVIFDSKGLEWKEHKSFIQDTGEFFKSLREKQDVSEHIHIVWYVINAGRGRVEDFELELVSKVFNPTPVIFVFNKADLVDNKTIQAVSQVIEEEKLPNNKGQFVCIANRNTNSQSWCPKCFSDDVIFDEETKELECCSCAAKMTVGSTYGLDVLIQKTCELLPELVKDAFMFSQTASLQEKDLRAKSVVLETARNVSLDMSGDFLLKVSEMCAKLFICWGWPLTAKQFQQSLATLQAEYVNKLRFQDRFAAKAIDQLLGHRLSKAFAGFIGYSMNRGMKKLNENLMIGCSKGNLDGIQLDDFFSEADLDEEVVQLFFEAAIVEGIEKALDKMWDMSGKELMELRKQMVLEGKDIFAGLDQEKQKEIQDLIQKHGTSNADIEIRNVDAGQSTPLLSSSAHDRENVQDGKEQAEDDKNKGPLVEYDVE